MTPRAYRLTPAAESDVAGVLRHTLRRFGAWQQQDYAKLILRAIDMVAEQPLQPASRGRSELGPGVRSFHLHLAGRRQGAAAHLLFYRMEVSEPRLVILRVLHEAMDPASHLEDMGG